MTRLFADPLFRRIVFWLAITALLGWPAVVP